MVRAYITLNEDCWVFIVDKVGVEDLKKHKIGALEAITDFFINYKTADGKPKNELWENGKFLDQV